MKLDKYKLLHQDERSYTVEHPSGKKLFIEKDKLSPKAHAEIQCLSDGGMLYKENKKINKVPQKDRFADGGPVSKDEVTDYGDIPLKESPFGDDPEQVDYQQPVSMADRAPDALASDDQSASMARLMKNSPAMAKIGSGQQIQGIIDSTPLDAPLAQAIPPQQAEEPIVQQKSQMGELFGKQQQELSQAQTEEAAATKEVANVQQNTANQLSAIPTQADIVNSYKAKDDKLAAAFAESKVDPQRLIHNMDTGSKIGVGIALILSGMGSATTGQPNYALDVLNKNIERDIDSQKLDQSNKMNLWKMNREMLGNDVAANLATKNQLLTATQFQLNAAQTRALLPQQKLRAQQAIDALEQQKIQNNMTRSLLSPPPGAGAQKGAKSNVDPALLVPEMVKDEAQKRPVLEEIKNRSNIAKNGKVMLDAFDKAVHELSGVTGVVHGALEYTPGQNALINAITPNVSGIDGTVSIPAMDNAKATLVPSYRDLGRPERMAAKRQALIDWMHSQSATPVSKSNYIDLDRYQKTSIPDFLAPGKNTATAPQPAVRYMNGVPYRLGEDGDMHRVKYRLGKDENMHRVK